MQHETRSLVLHLAGVAAVVSVLPLLDFALEAAFSGLGAGRGGFPAWLPAFGTVGQTVLTYSLVASAVAYVVVPAAVFALGYRYGRTRSAAT